MAFREIDDDLWAILEPHLPPQKPHIGRPRTDHRAMFNGIHFVLTTGCTWSDVPRKYGTKSTVHRFHLYLAEHGIYQDIFLDLLGAGYTFQKLDLTHCSVDTRDIQAKKEDRPVMMAIRR